MTQEPCISGILYLIVMIATWDQGGEKALEKYMAP